jgi:hypothetical protein
LKLFGNDFSIVPFLSHFDLDNRSIMIEAPKNDKGIAAVAGRQFGLITAVQLTELGISPNAITRRSQDGRLHRVFRGVYSVGYKPLSNEARLFSAVLAVGSRSALSHSTAARHLAVWKRKEALIHVTAPGKPRKRPSVVVHRSSTLHEDEITVLNGIPVTTVARTLFDLSGDLSPYEIANAIYEAEYRGIFDIDDVRKVLSRNKGTKGAKVLSRALELNAYGSAGTRSRLELEFLTKVLTCKVSEPMVNVELPTRDGMIGVDFWWPALRLVVEVDGPAHERQRSKRVDKQRDTLLRDQGIEVLRCTRAQFHSTIEYIRRLETAK